MSPRWSLVVVAYHRVTALADLLESVPRDGGEIVVVNVEHDAGITSLLDSQHPSVIQVIIGNRGFAAGVNAGIAACSASIVVISNDDVVFTPTSLEKLVSHVEKTGGPVAPALIDAHGRVQRSIASNVSLRRLFLEWALLPDAPPPGADRLNGAVLKWWRPTADVVVPGVAAAVLACPTVLLRREPMPEDYFLYWEEREWFSLLAHRGETVWYTPFSQVRHDGGRSVVSVEKQRLLVRNAVRCMRRIHGRRAAAAAVPIVLIWQGRLLLQAIVVGVFGRSDRQLLKTRWVGVTEAVGSIREVWTERP